MYPVPRNSKRVTIFTLVASFTVACAAVSASAQVTQPPPRRPAPAAVPARPAPAAPNEATPAPAESVAAEVTGFRSARFGMTEVQVRTAIEKDFRVRPDEIRSQENKAEQTQVLEVRTPDVLPGGGTANVSYVFGFKSRTLIQVGLSWSKATDDKMTPEQLFSNANILRSHFLEAGYKANTISTNMPISGGLLMFRGSDGQERTTVLVLQGTFSQGENNQRILTPTALLLFYIADAKSPDVYRLPPGSF
jgi:hypothetical protein